ncbi:MAG: hypothetical protein K8953_11895 [Proteobacteria bacterium]|nr:hypothetical protein [Pseudomonadota bacterium]
MMNNALRVFVIACANADQHGLLCVALLCEQGMPKALWLQDDRDSINLQAGYTRR